MTDLPFGDLAQASQAVQKKTISPVELTKACLQRIDRLNAGINAFITVTADSARKEAQRAEAEITRGEWKGPLHGIPLALKDLVETAGTRTTAASGVLKDFVPEKDAEVVSRLRAAGAVLLGKLNLHEFAYGGSGIISNYGPARNPWNTAHITGGSSSGSAAAVAAGLCYGAIGTDTAGSIRLPSSYCGISGFKPTYGLVSSRGVVPLSWSLDHVGPMARTAADLALLLQAIAHYDPEDVNSLKLPPVHYPAAVEESMERMWIGLPRDFWKDADQEVTKAVDQAVSILGKSLAGVKEIDLTTVVDRTVARCEPFAYHQKYLSAHEKDYQPETFKRIMGGQDVTAPQYIQAYRDMQRLRREVRQLFDKVDLIVTPTSPVLPATISELESAPNELRPRELMMLRNTRPMNVFGLPAVSVPCGFSASGLPIGLQIVGAPGWDRLPLALAHAYQKMTDWHTKRPPIT